MITTGIATNEQTNKLKKNETKRKNTLLIATISSKFYYKNVLTCLYIMLSFTIHNIKHCIHSHRIQGKCEIDFYPLLLFHVRQELRYISPIPNFVYKIHKIEYTYMYKRIHYMVSLFTCSPSPQCSLSPSPSLYIFIFICQSLESECREFACPMFPQFPS